MDRQEIINLRKQGKTFQEIANLYGCSRQYIHQVVNQAPKAKASKMHKPSKGELYAQVDALTKENIELQQRLDADQQSRWKRHTGRALSVFFKQIPFNRNQVKNVSLDHIDKAGYWFTFELDNDSTRQTYAVRHNELRRNNNVQAI